MRVQALVTSAVPDRRFDRGDVDLADVLHHNGLCAPSLPILCATPQPGVAHEATFELADRPIAGGDGDRPGHGPRRP